MQATVHFVLYLLCTFASVHVPVLLLSSCLLLVPSCTDGIWRLEVALQELEFPYLEDSEGEAFGEATWSNAIAMVKGLVGQDFTLVRRNHNRVRLDNSACCTNLEIASCVPFKCD